MLLLLLGALSWGLLGRPAATMCTGQKQLCCSTAAASRRWLQWCPSKPSVHEPVLVLHCSAQ